jgi:hypothetical protein
MDPLLTLDTHRLAGMMWSPYDWSDQSSAKTLKSVSAPSRDNALQKAGDTGCTRPREPGGKSCGSGGCPKSSDCGHDSIQNSRCETFEAVYG